MARTSFLLIDEGILPEWRALEPEADISVLQVPGASYLLQQPGKAAVDGEECLRLARLHAGRYDYVLAECTAGFLWHCLFRLAGDRTPFVIVPRFNHVHARNAYALLLSSQLRSPRDVLFTGSRAAGRSFGRFGFRWSPLYLPGVDLDRFKPLPGAVGELRASLGVPRGGPLLLYVGRLEEDKNVLELLDAVELARRTRDDIELAICFQFPGEEYARRCRERAESMGGVRLVREPDGRTLVRWYNAADLFVTAAVSDFETFGRAPVEAMACGTPPVVPAYDGFRESVTPETGFHAPTTLRGCRKWPDVERLAATILEALSDRDRLQRMSRAGPTRSRRYDYPRSIRAMVRELEEDGAGMEGGNGAGADSLSLEGYPSEIAGLWSPLEGEALEDLVVDFLGSWRVPIRPSEPAVRDFYTSWFSAY